MSIQVSRYLLRLSPGFYGLLNHCNRIIETSLAWVIKLGNSRAISKVHSIICLIAISDQILRWWAVRHIVRSQDHLDFMSKLEAHGVLHMFSKNPSFDALANQWS